MNAISKLLEQALNFESHGKYQEAEPYYLQALCLKEAVAGVGQLDLAGDYFNLGLLFFAQDKYAQAEEYLKRCLSIEEEVLGADHVNLLDTLQYLAESYFGQGHYEQAEKTYKRFIDLHARTRGQQGAELVNNLYNLAEICDLLGKANEGNDLRTKAQSLLSDELTTACRRKAS